MSIKLSALIKKSEGTHNTSHLNLGHRAISEQEAFQMNYSAIIDKSQKSVRTSNGLTARENKHRLI